MLKVVCINNSNRPNEIRLCNWPRLDTEYTVVKMKRSIITSEKFFELEEIKPDSPYGGYKVERFGVDISDILKLIEEKVLEEELIWH